MQKLPSFALVPLIGATLAPSAFASPAPTPTTPPTLVGKAPTRWVIPRKAWTNTPQAVWLGGLKGHVTVIEFFRINCSHCQEAAPSRRALYLKYHKLGLEMVGFQSPGDVDNPENEENNWSQVKNTIRQWQLPYPIAFDRKRALFNEYGLGFYPTILVLDKEGVVRFQQTGFDEKKENELEQFLAQALKDEPAAK